MSLPKWTIPTALGVFAVLLGVLIGASSSMQVIAVVLLCVALIAAVRYPYQVASLALAIGALLPGYVVFTPAWLPVDMNGPLVVSVILFFVAVVLWARGQRIPRALVVPVTIFSTIWLAGPFITASGGPVARVAYVIGFSGSGVLGALGMMVIASDQRGRSAAIRGIAGAGVIAAAYAVYEVLRGDNPILRTAALYNSTAAQYLDVPLRFGLRRASGTLSHPIMLSILLGIASVCVFSLWRQGRLRAPVALGALAFMGVVDIATLSRLPVVLLSAVLAGWVLMSSEPTLQRIRVPVLAMLAGVLVVTSLVVPNALGLLLDTGGTTEAGDSVTYRLQLTETLVREFKSAPLFGESANQVFLADFGSLDSQIAALLRSRGWFGLAGYVILLLAPLIRRPRPREHGGLAFALVIFIGIVGLGAAIFGPVQLYVICALVLAGGLTAPNGGRLGAL